MKNFQKIKEWLNEQEKQDGEYGCVMIYTNIRDWKENDTN